MIGNVWEWTDDLYRDHAEAVGEAAGGRGAHGQATCCGPGHTRTSRTRAPR